MMTFKYMHYFSLLLILVSLNSHAAIDVHEFDTESQRERYNVLVDELRCPKCQNQNLEGSNSQIATDLRRELHRLLSEGKTDREIKDFMVARYGEFVLYKPRLQTNTLALWFMPVLMLFIGAIILLSIIRQRKKAKLQTMTSDERSQLDSLLNDKDSK
jgi:cytochrome c-type biogenesis protein CcmH